MLRAIVFLMLSAPAFADTLVNGSVYFDSQKTLEEVVKLSAEKDNASILKLISNGHVSQRTDSDRDIVVLITGFTPESPAEFRFPSEPTTYWTLTKFVIKSVEPVAIATPTPTPERSLSLTAKRKSRESESDDPSDDDDGQRIWHKVDGKWKWYPANKHPVPVRRALPPD